MEIRLNGLNLVDRKIVLAPDGQDPVKRLVAWRARREGLDARRALRFERPAELFGDWRPVELAGQAKRGHQAQRGFENFGVASEAALRQERRRQALAGAIA